jgi:hypothetical protein
MLSYFTLPNSNHERKSSPIEKTSFCVGSFLTWPKKSPKQICRVRHLDIEFVRPIRKGHRRWLGWLSALFARPAGQHRFAVRHIDCPETSGQAGLSNID